MLLLLYTSIKKGPQKTKMGKEGSTIKKMLYKMLDDMLALANSVFVLGLPRSNRHVHGLLLCARLVLCCALLAVLLL